MTADQLLAAGRYAEIAPGDDPHSRAAWAFARYHLAPGREAARAAQLAHDQGDALGTFVYLLCQRKGAGVLHDAALMDRLNYQLRTRLEAVASPSPLELYVLSHCLPGNKAGQVVADTPAEMPALHLRHAQECWQRLRQAADLDFAQACSDVAGTFQRQQDFAQAYQWFRRAGDLGLGEGKRGAGAMMMRGEGVARDPVAEAALTRGAADAGDAIGMINVAVLHERGTGLSRDRKTARVWIDRAARTGHWMALQEKGISLLEGHYGYTIDEVQGKQLLQQAARTGHCEPLLTQARFYAEGVGVKRNLRLSIRFAEAAFRQGNRLAAQALVKIHNLEEELPLLLRIAAIDPFSLVVE